MAKMATTENIQSDGGEMRRKHVEPLDSIAPLLALRRSETLQSLGPIQDSRAPPGIHVVEPGQRIQAILLDLRRQFTEAGLIFKCALLLHERHTGVAFHPSLQVLFLPRLRRVLSEARLRTGWPGVWNRGKPRLRHRGKHGDKQRECRTETESDWSLHDHVVRFNKSGGR